MAQKPAEDALDALDRAQEVFWEACEARSVKQRLALAEKAIAISPLCADALVMLAEHEERGSDTSLALWQRAVDAGREALGDEFEELRGEFWGFLETRPYMRARFGLAWSLWDRGEAQAALTHLQGMLELNPNDNQGVRYILASWLLEAGRDDELHELLKRYPDDGAASWSWTTALAAFRREGDTPAARRLLLMAFKENKHIPAYLCGERAVPKSLPPFMSMGGEDEAVHYVSESAKGWSNTEGAIDWLRANLPASASSGRAAKPASKPKSAPKAKSGAKAKPKTPAGRKTKAAGKADSGAL